MAYENARDWWGSEGHLHVIDLSEFVDGARIAYGRAIVVADEDAVIGIILFWLPLFSSSIQVGDAIVCEPTGPAECGHFCTVGEPFRLRAMMAEQN